jgi:tetraacyldisaccharide 4'-kinase
MKIKFLSNLIITPLSYFWSRIYAFRRFLYEYDILKREYYKVPVISVGNLSFGGTGKTPFVLWLTGQIEKSSLKPLVLTRGYKGELENSKGLLSSQNVNEKDPSIYGDEPYLIARRSKQTSVAVGKNRIKNLEYYFSRVLPDVVILDDGFQHLKLFRNFNIVLFDSLLSRDGYYCAPKGYLREDLPALRYADCILFSRANKVDNNQLKKLIEMIAPYKRRNCLIGYFDYKCDGIYNHKFDKIHDLDYLNGKKIIFLSAIASPESFYKILDGYDVEVVDKIEFADHHNFSSTETEKIQKEFDAITSTKKIMLTTEKDFVRLEKSIENLFYIPIETSFLANQQDDFDTMVMRHVQQNRC